MRSMSSPESREHVPTPRLPPAGAAYGIPPWLRWHLNRLRCMSPAEIPHRVVRTLSMHAERAGLFGAGAIPEPAVTDTAAPWIHATASVAAEDYVAAADRLAAGRFDVFALSGVDLGATPRWNRDPKTGVEAPLTFGKLLDYRDSRRVGDIKYLWEINRHLHIVTLAQGYALCGERRYLAAIRRHIESWIAACPYGLGPNWASALEVAIRLINWSVAWQLVGGADSPLFRDSSGVAFRRQWLEAIYRHAQFIRGHFSLYSSANNHLIGEAAGLFVAALTWPYWPQAHAWLTESETILEREVQLQNAPDGVNREQAVAYQQFTLDLLLLALLAGRENGRPLSAAYATRVEAMMEFVASIMDVGGNMPAFGDADDASVVQFAPRGTFCRYRSLLATGALLFQRGDFKAKAGALDDKTRWLFGAGADAAFHGLRAAARLPVRRAFPWGGYYILGCDFETEHEIRLVADAGPLGYQTIAAHGHADALSFTLSVGGTEFLVDPGTYAYHTQRHWRDYFRGTGAHNTVRVDGVDQSQSGGNFMWLRKASARCDLWSCSPERDQFEGWHDGYKRLSDPVVHRRRITVDKQARRIVIVDWLEMRGTHELELVFHCSAHCRVARAGAGYRLMLNGKTLLLRLPQLKAAIVDVHFGSMIPICGWVSRGFDEKEPAPTIVWRARVAGPCVLRTELDCEEAAKAAARSGSREVSISP
jgi:hypothetical protein